jgi:hypothetical protein
VVVEGKGEGTGYGSLFPGTDDGSWVQVKVGQAEFPPRLLDLKRQARFNKARRYSRGRQESSPGMLAATMPSTPLSVSSSNTRPDKRQQCRQCTSTRRALRTLTAKRDVAAVFSPVGGCCSRENQSYASPAQLVHSVQIAGSGIDTMGGALKVECNTRASGEASWIPPEDNWPGSVDMELLLSGV